MTLQDFFADHPRAALAFSGGVDSAFLLWAGVHSGVQIQPYYVKTAFQPAFELEDARCLCTMLDVPLRILPLDLLQDAAITRNPPDRCYHCKRRIFGAILTAAREDGYPILLDGTNASDDASDRPGMRALRELKVLSPLRDCGLTKTAVREASREAGLFTWDKPAYACLATRLPTGAEVREDRLQATERAEDFLHKLGFRDFRVRWRDGAALLQLREADFPLAERHWHEIRSALQKEYTAVYLDKEVRR